MSSRLTGVGIRTGRLKLYRLFPSLDGFIEFLCDTREGAHINERNFGEDLLR